MNLTVCTCVCVIQAFEGRQGITSRMLGDLVINCCLATTHHLSCPLTHPPPFPPFLSLSLPSPLLPLLSLYCTVALPPLFSPPHPFTPCHMILSTFSLTLISHSRGADVPADGMEKPKGMVRTGEMSWSGGT